MPTLWKRAYYTRKNSFRMLGMEKRLFFPTGIQTLNIPNNIPRPANNRTRICNIIFLTSRNIQEMTIKPSLLRF